MGEFSTFSVGTMVTEIKLMIGVPLVFLLRPGVFGGVPGCGPDE